MQKYTEHFGVFSFIVLEQSHFLLSDACCQNFQGKVMHIQENLINQAFSIIVAYTIGSI